MPEIDSASGRFLPDQTRIQIEGIGSVSGYVREHFWEWHTKMPSGCWEWSKSLNNKGYGQQNIGVGHVVLAHRLAYALSNGGLTAPQVLHRCDNPKCVNPDHLSQGTQSDNMQDAVAKGRMRNWCGRRGDLDRSGANLIMQMDLTYAEISRLTGVSMGVISRIKRREYRPKTRKW